MNALKFTLSGQTAFFKKPDVNTYLYFSYNQIHKVALLGLLGAILGMKGYNQQQKEDMFPEFYERLQDLKIAIRPESPKGYFNKKMQSFNNSVGYASKEKGGNLIVKEQWLEKPRWTIYINLDHPEGTLIEKHFLTRQFIYHPYLGKNDHFADIYNIEVVTLQKETKAQYIDTLFPKENITIKRSESDIWATDIIDEWKYEEYLPLALNPTTNLYILEPYVFTNMQVDVMDHQCLFKHEQLNLYFI